MDGVQLGLIAELDERAEAEFQRLDDALQAQGLTGRQTRNVPYHITLGLYPEAMEDKLIELVDQNCGKLRSFPVTFQHIGLFGLDVLFLGPDPSHELLDLHKQFELVPDDCWSPHSTLYIDDRDKVLQAIPIIAERFSRIEATVERVGLYRFPPSHLLRMCPLLKG